jgi:hypothetical protein
MKNFSNFLHRRRGPFIGFIAAFVPLLLILAFFMASCGKNSKEENIQEVLLKDKTFQEFVTTKYQMQKLWLDGSVTNSAIASMDPYKFSAQFDRALTDSDRIKALQEAGYLGDLAKLAELLVKGDAARDRFKEKFPNLAVEEVLKADQTYVTQELGEPDYTNFLKKRTNEK